MSDQNTRLVPISPTNRSFRAARRSGPIVLLLLIAAWASVAAAQQEPTGNGTARRGGESPTTRPARGSSGGRGFGGLPPARIPVLGEGPTCTFDATVYDLRVPADQIGRLDIAALANASETVDGFEKALAALGIAKPIYRTDQSVRLSGDRINIGAQSPYVSDTRLNAQGQGMNTISYMSTGAIFSLAGKASPPAGLDVDLNIQVSSFLDSGLTVGDSKAPVIHNATLSHKGPVQPRKPFIVVTVDAGSLDKDGKAVAYIGRIIVGEPR
jgi:hypothetical protein